MSSLASLNLRLPPAVSGLVKHAPRAVMAALVVFIAWRLTALTWLLLPGAPAPSAPPAAPAAAAGSGSAVNVEALARLHLFGQASAEQAAAIAAPTTDLALTLRGVWAFPEASKRASAVIEASGEQSVVFVGEALPGGANATLKQVFPDRVILDRGGRLETLHLLQDGDASGISLTPVAPGSEAGASGATLDRRKDAQLQKRLVQVRRQLAENPLSLMKLVTAQPVQEDGRLVGFKVAPGSDPKLFSRVGLQKGDVITAVNGLPLTDPSVLQQVQAAPTLNVSVRRGGATLSLLLGAEPQSQPEQEGRRPPPPLPETTPEQEQPQEFNPYNRQGDTQ